MQCKCRKLPWVYNSFHRKYALLSENFILFLNSACECLCVCWLGFSMRPEEIIKFTELEQLKDISCF